ncbi:MAG: hypothetical protein J0I40_01845 [Cellulomonas sp.]|uniref:hypothetical protein n=1 Tax=Cellulomonas sp. 73-92 TaxID=1895740 RepID=UPI00092859E6|nr:hypothetical protein [Cellulomonas sp. 73-92]MBN9374135.1 hypothetical protein [Cellulomonas sp.]OJV76483.1 MAG: hypothetical protein BGO37_10515 [Cellulomonas sp. 73-92]
MTRGIDELLTPVTCRHGGRAGRRPDGELWCPICRTEQARAAAEAEAREEAHQRHLAYLRRLGWRNGRPPRDAAMRRANDDYDPDSDSD